MAPHRPLEYAQLHRPRPADRLRGPQVRQPPAAAPLGLLEQLHEARRTTEAARGVAVRQRLGPGVSP